MKEYKHICANCKYLDPEKHEGQPGYFEGRYQLCKRMPTVVKKRSDDWCGEWAFGEHQEDSMFKYL